MLTNEVRTRLPILVVAKVLAQPLVATPIDVHKSTKALPNQ